MNRTFQICVPLTVVAFLSSCTTWVDVKKVAPSSHEAGLRYSLPATYLLVQPQADGTASYSWVYLPDSDATYAINQHAFLAKFTLDVTLANGLLSKVNAQSDNTAVAAKLFDAAQSAYAAKEQAIGTQRKADAATLATAKAAVATAQLAFNQAQLESDAINAPNSTYTDDQKRAAALKLIDTQAALTQAKATLSALVGNAAADLPAQQQWGPVLFRVNQDASGGVKLVAANGQVLFDTITAASAALVVTDYTLKLQTPSPIKSSTPLVLTIAISTAIVAPDPVTTAVLRSDGSSVTNHPTLTLSDDKKTLTVIFPSGLPRGSYILLPAVVLQAGQPAVARQQVTFEVT